MIKSYNAYTYEVDDVELAVHEILNQLNINDNLLKNSVGILTCFSEYIDSGVVEEICKIMPFDIVGITTIASVSANIIGETVLNLLVLTSDDICFATGLTDDLYEEDPTILKECYERTRSKLPNNPSLIFSFAPLLFNIGGDFYVNNMNDISNGVPNFGTIATDHNEDYSESKVIYNGEAWLDRYAFILVCGDINPKFYIGTISDEKIFSEKAVVTKSNGNQLQYVNGIPITEYLISLGLKQNDKGDIIGINTFPIIVDYNDGATPTIYSMFAISPEGSAVCGGNIPEGARISIGRFDAEEIKYTTAKTIEKSTIDTEKGNGIYIMYSCIGRYFAQGINPLDEANYVKNYMHKMGLSYMLAYSGGEICPVYRKNNTIINRFHNNTFIVCAL